jgi:hypothetical protein
MNIIASIRELAENGKNHGNKKELVSAYSIVGIRNGQLKELVTCRAYMGRSRSASTVYASVWIKMPDGFASGHGDAGGYGYHKESAAIAYAIQSAGIDLSEDIAGRGDSAIREALLALGKLAGGKGELLLIQH